MSPSSVLKFFLIFRNIHKILSIPKIGLTSIECDDFVTRNKLIISQILLNVQFEQSVSNVLEKIAFSYDITTQIVGSMTFFTTPKECNANHVVMSCRIKLHLQTGHWKKKFAVCCIFHYVAKTFYTQDKQLHCR